MTSGHADPQATREALLADCRQSGARANPKVLKELLHHLSGTQAKTVRALVTRQGRRIAAERSAVTRSVI